MSYLLGLDIGTSSIKACLLDSETGREVGSAASPDTELSIESPEAGWAEQHPHVWWEHTVKASKRLLDKAKVDASAIKGIGISYQMHGLVCIDKEGEVLRPSIIWCDSRAVAIGDAACEAIGRERCLDRLLNSPGNFTASKLRWVQQHEPELYGKIDKIMLPGDWIAFKLTGQKNTTASGLSEGIMWDFKDDAPASVLLEHYGIDNSLLPELVPTFGDQGSVSAEAAAELGITTAAVVAYRGGDQPNNALSLNVLQPGELAATAGTSGVVYGVSDRADADPQSRVNTFVHVNHDKDAPRYGVLLCINGTGCCNSWLKREVATVGDTSLDYPELNELAATAPIGSDGLSILPFGNGAERTLGNKDVGAGITGLNFNVHTRAHMMRAAQEGIVFSMKYGIDAMAAAGVSVNTVRAGQANLFLSPLFRQAFTTAIDATVELYDTDGAQGAARGAGLGIGLYADASAAFESLEKKDVIEPVAADKAAYESAYAAWCEALALQMR